MLSCIESIFNSVVGRSSYPLTTTAFMTRSNVCKWKRRVFQRPSTCPVPSDRHRACSGGSVPCCGSRMALGSCSASDMIGRRYHHRFHRWPVRVFYSRLQGHCTPRRCWTTGRCTKTHWNEGSRGSATCPPLATPLDMRGRTTKMEVMMMMLYLLWWEPAFLSDSRFYEALRFLLFLTRSLRWKL